ncbi:hypothetical protein OG758_41120 [Streptomyces sp. NBC_01474]|uniref:hypothetical protein n=1 Tax=unclassified Streptomyces TaxID=2593676 RepID=UPI002DD93234|nr:MULTISPECIES: hypothetical protein [unclassified Streptomyces]WSE00028.1 hypothetical protein OG758_41120 [Streptomyces sp. NBC_01474]
MTVGLIGEPRTAEAALTAFPHGWLAGWPTAAVVGALVAAANLALPRPAPATAAPAEAPPDPVRRVT